jgi:dTDP-glucose pyrophosphorylase
MNTARISMESGSKKKALLMAVTRHCTHIQNEEKFATTIISKEAHIHKETATLYHDKNTLEGELKAVIKKQSESGSPATTFGGRQANTLCR